LLWANLQVSTTTLNILLIFGLVLDDQILALVAERVKARCDPEELGVLLSLDALVSRLVREPLASFVSNPLRACVTVQCKNLLL
jgi:hypothetical protein